VYCGVECQSHDWNQGEHQLTCAPFTFIMAREKQEYKHDVPFETGTEKPLILFPILFRRLPYHNEMGDLVTHTRVYCHYSPKYREFTCGCENYDVTDFIMKVAQKYYPTFEEVYYDDRDEEKEQITYDDFNTIRIFKIEEASAFHFFKHVAKELGEKFGEFIWEQTTDGYEFTPEFMY
jgi:hypothetical protein